MSKFIETDVLIIGSGIAGGNRRKNLTLFMHRAASFIKGKAILPNY